MTLGKACSNCSSQLTTKSVIRLGLQIFPNVMMLLGNCKACHSTIVLAKRAITQEALDKELKRA